MKIHFLNVGHGDCTIIEHDSGRITMVDINNGDDIDETSAKEIATETASRYDDMYLAVAEAVGIQRKGILKTAGYDVQLTNPVEYFKQHFPGREIFRYVQSHPDLDHMRGLNALWNEGIVIRNVWDTWHTKVPDFKTDNDRIDWGRYQRLRNGEWRKPGDATVLKYYRGTRRPYFNQNADLTDGGDGIHILAPTRETNATANISKNYNNLSYVLYLVANDTRIILGGDAEADVWKSIHDCYGSNLKCDILKASHHGRDSGYYQPAVAAMKPEFTIVSVGKKPSTDASNKYRAYSNNVWSTRWKGDIVVNIPAYSQPTIDSEYDR
jgi:competence protein ComEC